MNKTSPTDLENNYTKADPWGYKTNHADIMRKNYIIGVVRDLEVSSVLDIGCGEGWITGDLPVKDIYGFEASTSARLRWPNNVSEFKYKEQAFDLALLTGVLYQNYDWENMVDMAMRSEKYIVTCHIAGREHSEAIKTIQDKFDQKFCFTFPYDRGLPGEDFVQVLRMFKHVLTVKD